MIDPTFSSPVLRTVRNWSAAKLKAAAGKDDVLVEYDAGTGWLGYLFLATGMAGAPAFDSERTSTGGPYSFATVSAGAASLFASSPTASSRKCAADCVESERGELPEVAEIGGVA